MKIEIENELQLTFLDVLVIKEWNSRSNFKIFRKEAHVDSYIHWFSSHSR